MKRTPKLMVYAVFAVLCFLAALALGRGELVALGAPFALVLVLGLVHRPASLVEAELRLERRRVLEGEEVELALVVGSEAASSWLETTVIVPRGLRISGLNSRPASTREVVGREDVCYVLRVGGGEHREVPLRLVCERWGAYRVGDVLTRSVSPYGMLTVESLVRGSSLLRVYPRPERLRVSIRPRETQPFVGNHVSRSQGEGVEFAGTRPYLPGDRPRRINWRATTARGVLYVDEQHPERNADVVIFLDTFSEARRLNESLLGLAVRAAASLAEDFLATRDRVGLVAFGGVLRWLTPAAGEVQHYRITEALLETESALSFAWKDLDVVPRRVLPAQALVVALSPLLDERSVQALLDLRRRGFDLVVVEISPLRFVEEPSDGMHELAWRLWRLWRETLRYRYERLGVAVVTWDGTGPLAGPVEEARAFRRFVRYTSA